MAKESKDKSKTKGVERRRTTNSDLGDPVAQDGRIHRLKKVSQCGNGFFLEAERDRNKEASSSYRNHSGRGQCLREPERMFCRSRKLFEGARHASISFIPVDWLEKPQYAATSIKPTLRFSSSSCARLMVLELHWSQCRACRVLYDSSRKTLKIVTDSGSFDLPNSVSDPIIDSVMARLRNDRS